MTGAGRLAKKRGTGSVEVKRYTAPGARQGARHRRAARGRGGGLGPARDRATAPAFAGRAFSACWWRSNGAATSRARQRAATRSPCACSSSRTVIHRTERLVATALPVMRDLAGAIGQSCHLAVHDDGRILVLCRVESPQPWGLTVRVGAAYAMTANASGRVLLAFQPPDIRARWLARARAREGDSGTGGRGSRGSPRSPRAATSTARAMRSTG